MKFVKLVTHDNFYVINVDFYLRPVVVFFQVVSLSNLSK